MLGDAINSNSGASGVCFCQSFGFQRDKSNFVNQLQYLKYATGLNISVNIHVLRWWYTDSFQAAEKSKITSETNIYSNISWQGGPVGLKEQYWDHFSSQLRRKNVNLNIASSQKFPSVSGKRPFSVFSDPADH